MENKEKDINPLDPIDLSIFKEHIKNSFLSILDSLPANEKKTLVMERTCIRKLDFFTDFNSIKKKNVEGGIVILERMALMTEEKIVIYVIPPKTECLDIIKLQVFNHQSERKDKKYYVIFIPKINYMCQKYIELNYLKSEIKIMNLNIDIFPFDYDLISLEENNALQEVYIDGNLNILSVLNRVILKFETVFGSIKYKYYKGNSAKKLKELIEKEEEGTKFQTNNSILAAMIFDRNVDFVTPFCTQGTYEGILDEHFDIQYNSIKIKASILEKDSKNDVKVDLSNSDRFYSSIKDYHFNKIRVFLPEKLNEHDKVFSEGKQSSELSQIQKTLEKVKQIKEERASLTNHINIAAEIGKYQAEPRTRHYTHIEQELLAGGEYTTLIEDFLNEEMGKQTDPLYILKLLCLYSVIINGLAYKTYIKLKREFLHCYGFQNLFLWTQLEKMGILKSYQSRGYYESISDGLKLINENVNTMEVNDCSYVFGGYCPIIVRLIEKAVTDGWGSISKILKQLPGEYEFPSNEKEVFRPNELKNFILLVFIGGITYAEIGAIRYLNTKMEKHKFIIITTGLIHGKRILTGLKKTFESNLTMKDFHLQLKQLSLK